MLLDPLRPSEIEFLAESTMIEIMPSIPMETLHFISVRVWRKSSITNTFVHFRGTMVHLGQ